MQVKAGISKITDTNVEGGIEVKVQFQFIILGDQEKGARIELFDLMGKTVLITMDRVQTQFTFGKGDMGEPPPGGPTQSFE